MMPPIDEVLCLFFHRYHRLSLPGVGQLQQIVVPAQLDFPNKKMVAPTVSVRFIPGDGKDDLFISWLSKELNVSAGEVLKDLTNFSARLTQSLSDSGTFRWEGVGFFRLKDDQQIEVESVYPATESAVLAEKVIRAGATHAVLVGEEEKTSKDMELLLNQSAVSVQSYWWVYALLFLLISLASIFAVRTFLPHTWNHLGNYEPIQLEQAPPVYKEGASSE